jgi:hypothetical protein
MLANAYGAIIFGELGGVLGAERRVAKRPPIVANAYGIIAKGAQGAERRVSKSASIVASAYGTILKKRSPRSIARAQECVHGGLR